MKKLILSAIFTVTIFQFNVFAQKSFSNQEVVVLIDLNNVKDDKVLVTIIPPTITSKEIVFHIPKTVPGTYSEDNYGKLIDDFEAFDDKGKMIKTSKVDSNSWKISKATSLTKITYWVNDTFDSEKGEGFGKSDIFSPAGSNILAGKNFVLNNHCFVGYFDDMEEIAYDVKIEHPISLVATTSLEDINSSETVDNFVTSRYFDLVDNPIMYAKPDFETFTVDGMQILFSVYSPNGIHSAKELLPNLEKMIRAQKAFLGSINNNKKYTVLLYLSDFKKEDAMGYGALEHHGSTTVVFPEMMPVAELDVQLIDVVSHEFFHTVTPLTIHSKEIQYFDYNKPKMSKHLWMYEGVTEYFANLFQVNQGLITPDEFYQRMVGKIENAKEYNDTMSFTEMSAGVLEKPYKQQYNNVYEKGALIGMCIDIIIREKSDGKQGVLELMKALSMEYGVDKPFDDEELFSKIVELTYPEVGEFLNNYVSGKTPIPYEQYFAKMGVSKIIIKETTNPFLNDKDRPLVTVDPKTKEIILVALNFERNNFIKALDLKSGDVILAINNVNYNLDNIYDMIMESQNWKEGDEVTIKIKRDGVMDVLKGPVKLSYHEVEGIGLADTLKERLNTAWLKG